MIANNESRRRRRAPDDARREILDAATQVIAERGPDHATLAAVADVAGVTSGLVSHYFGTYDQLVREVLREENTRHRAMVRDRIAQDDGVPYATQMIDVVFDTLADEQYLRLWTWSALHPDHDTLSSDGLAGIADVMLIGLRQALPADRVPSRDRVDAVLLLGMAAAYGYALGGASWQRSLGHDPEDTELATSFRRALSAAVSGYLTQEQA